ncbi:putative protein OS=Streptomyces albaduncus OX=68172 GN=FHS32_003315 PE=4 SV=1 [Streptomyces griseoloalbus]
MSDTPDRNTTWADTLRRPWTALVAAAAVVLGPGGLHGLRPHEANAAPLRQTPSPHRRL